MDKELLEIKTKILNFCNEYNIKDIKIETAETCKTIDKTVTFDIAINIEV